MVLTLSAFTQTEDDFAVTLNRSGDGVVITKYKGKVAQVTIPSTIQGMPVREIGDSAFSEFISNVITHVVIPAGVTKIGDGAFSHAAKLVSVTISEGVTEIGRTSFMDCRALQTVVLPQSLITIGDFAFNGCATLREITLPASLKGIGAHAFSYCKALTTVTIPDSVESIYFGEAAFKGCSNLNLANQAALRRVGYRDNF